MSARTACIRSNARRTAYYVESTTRTQCYAMAVAPVCREVYECLESPGFGMTKWQRYHDRQDRSNFANYLLQRPYLILHITGGSGSGLDRELDVISPFISGPKRPPKPAVLSGIVELEWELLGEPPSHREGFDPRRAGRNVGHMYPACSTLT